MRSKGADMAEHSEANISPVTGGYILGEGKRQGGRKARLSRKESFGCLFFVLVLLVVVCFVFVLFVSCLFV